MVPLKGAQQPKTPPNLLKKETSKHLINLFMVCAVLLLSPPLNGRSGTKGKDCDEKEQTDEKVPACLIKQIAIRLPFLFSTG